MTDRMHASALSNEQLMSIAYDDDTLSQPEREHLEQCAICQQQLTAYRETNTRLRSRLYRTLCPDAIRLNYYCLGMVPEEERVAVASHLLDCPSCADEVAEIRRLQASVELYPPTAFSPGAFIRRLFATLVVQQAQPVVRDDVRVTGWPRQYRAESLDLSLHLSRASNGEMMLLGIITSSDPEVTVDAFEGAIVGLYNAPGPLSKDSQEAETSAPFLFTEVDDVGNIMLEPVAAGSYVMIVRLPEEEIVIEGLDITQQ